MKRLFVHFLLIERPPELVQSQFEVRRVFPDFNCRRVSEFGFVVIASREEVLAATKLNFVEIGGIGIAHDHLFDHSDRVITSA